MRPDSRRLATICFALTGIENHHPIDLAVVVAVILAEIRSALVMRQFTRFFHQLIWMLVITPIIVRSVVRSVFADRHRTIHVYLHIVLSPTLVVKILMNRTRSTVIGVGFTHCPIGHIFIGLLECLIFIAHQDNRSAWSQETIRTGLLFCPAPVLFRLHPFASNLSPFAFHFFAHRHQGRLV